MMTYNFIGQNKVTKAAPHVIKGNRHHAYIKKMSARHQRRVEALRKRVKI